MGLSQGVPRVSCPGHPWHRGSRRCVMPDLHPPDPLWRSKISQAGGGCPSRRASSISCRSLSLQLVSWRRGGGCRHLPAARTLLWRRHKAGLVPTQGRPRPRCLGTPSCRPSERGGRAAGPRGPPHRLLPGGRAAPGVRASGFWAQRGHRAHAVPSPVCVLQAQTQELEELNKELRQCNLQQFIQQTGATVTIPQARSEEDAQPEPSPRELPACRRDGGQHAGSARGCSAGPPPAPCLPFQGGQHPLQGGRPQSQPVLPWALGSGSRDRVSVLARWSLITQEAL